MQPKMYYNNLKLKDKSKTIICRKSLKLINNLSLTCTCNKELCNFSHYDENQKKSCDYLLFDHLVNNDLLIQSIEKIRDKILYKPIMKRDMFSLNLNNWSKFRSNKIIPEFSKLTIAEYITYNCSDLDDFEEWEKALARESIRRNRICNKNKLYVAKILAGIKVEESDICVGGINCNNGIHFNIDDFKKQHSEAVTFNDNKQKLLFDISFDTMINNLKLLSDEEKLNKLLNSSLFDFNIGVKPKKIILGSSSFGSSPNSITKIDNGFMIDESIRLNMRLQEKLSQLSFQNINGKEIAWDLNVNKEGKLSPTIELNSLNRSMVSPTYLKIKNQGFTL